MSALSMQNTVTAKSILEVQLKKKTLLSTKFFWVIIFDLNTALLKYNKINKSLFKVH